jgi:CheY-like chemotaxis protein
MGSDGLCATFSDSRDALAHIQRVITKNEILKHVIGVNMQSEDYSLLSKTLPVNYSLSNIWQNVYRQDCFSEISVVFVDYEMPGMNGEELCVSLRQILPNPVKIVMLTAEADDQIAIKLLNEGLIDQFLRKSQLGLTRKLKEVRADMQAQYFLDLTNPIMAGLVANNASFLNDASFRVMFDKVCADVRASSYFLLEPSGSFLLVDDDAKPTWLVVKTLDEMRELAGLLEDSGVPPALADRIRSGELIPYFLDSTTYIDPGDGAFEQRLCPGEIVKGDRNYAYAVTGNLYNFPIDRDRIFSFNEHRKRTSAPG